MAMISSNYYKNRERIQSKIHPHPTIYQIVKSKKHIPSLLSQNYIKNLGEQPTFRAKISIASE